MILQESSSDPPGLLSLRRSTAQTSWDIHVRIPNLGSIHFCRANHPARIASNQIHSDMFSPFLRIFLTSVYS